MSTLVLLLAFLFNQQEKPPEKCVISGTVFDSVTAKALNKVEVLLDMHGEKWGEPAAAVTTDDKGKFRIEGIEPGQYFLLGSRNGYLETYSGTRRAGDGRTAIRLEPGQEIKDVAIKLFPAGVLAGMVLDTDGEPLVGAVVSVWAVHFTVDGKTYAQLGEASTDDLGQYRIPNLKPGKYYVRARLETHANSVEAFYPGVLDPGTATMVELTPGAHLTSLNIAMPRPPPFRVTVRVSAPAGFQVWCCWLHSGREEFASDSDYNSLVTGYRSNEDSRGRYVFEHVPSGSYMVAANASEPRPCQRGMTCIGGGGGVTVNASPRLDVGNADVEDFRINIAPGATIAAHLSVEGDTKLPTRELYLRFRGHGGTTSLFGEDLRLTTPISLGRYDLLLTEVPGMFLKSIRSGSTDVLRDGLTISGGNAIPIEVVLSDQVGNLDGVVLDKDEKPMPGATVLLIPEESLRPRGDRFCSGVTDQMGRYHFKDLAPGDYKAVAWDDVEPGAWFDPEFLKSAEPGGVAVAIQPKGHDTLQVHAQTGQ